MKFPPPLYIALRFFFESKRSMALSAAGVVFGVAFFIVALAQTAGFEGYFVQTTLGTSGSIVISDRFQQSYSMILGDGQGGKSLISVDNQKRRKFYPGINDAYRVIRVIKEYPGVSACSPIIEERAFLKSSFQNEVVVVHGIDLDYHLAATDLAEQVVRGSIDDFRGDSNAIAVGALVADKLQLKVGQNVYIVSNSGDSRRFRLTTVYQTGINAVDEKRVYVHRRAAQSVLRINSTSMILVRLQDPEKAPELSLAFEDLLSHRSRSWQEREKGNLQILSTLRISAAVGVSTIILLAGFGIFNVLTMSVLEKTKEIAILRSMGYTRKDIASIFLWQGVGIAGVGIILGSVIGAAMTFIISKIPIQLRGVVRADHFIVEWSWTHYALAAFLAILSVFIASYAPARRAARLKPVDILRGSVQ